MTYPLEYHSFVNRPTRRSIPLSLALCTALLLVSSAVAQIGSMNSGSANSNSGHFASVAPPTASVAPRTGPVAPPTGAFVHNGYIANSGLTLSTRTPHSPTGSHGNGNEHRPHHTANGNAYYPYVYALPVPYALDVSAADNDDNNNDDDDDANYQGGPTIFDRRGSGPDSYIPPSSDGPAHDPTQSAAAADADEPPQPPTTLVFKDGHQIEVNNYAIVSQILYDLTPGHARKIALADLDLVATQKQNDDRGIVFQLPPLSQAN